MANRLLYNSSTIYVGKVAVGGYNPIRIQSMTTTNTLDTASTVNQISELAAAGCDFVRVTTRNIKEATNLENIQKELNKKGIDIPLIADVHYNPKVAEVAARYAAKVRINPGNYVDKNILRSPNINVSNAEILVNIKENLLPLLHICNQNGTAIRIGVNHGSLSERILFKYGNTPQGMVESIMEFVNVCYGNNFNNLVLSLKASNVRAMIEANALLINRLNLRGINYPIHLGVTEAGNQQEGRVKSATGIGYLLAHGIGDTIRVSLSEDPVNEIPVAKIIVEFYGKRKNISYEIKCHVIKLPNVNIKTKPLVVTKTISDFSDITITDKPSLQTNLINDNYLSIFKLLYHKLTKSEIVIKASVDAAIMFLDNTFDGIFINDDSLSPNESALLSLNILQALGLRITKTEYVSCPTCGRSSVDVIRLINEIKERTSQLPGLKIAIMGCAVNGPGEMADANYGIVGVGNGNVNIYRGKTISKANVPNKMAIESLINLIKENGDWKTGNH